VVEQLNGKFGVAEVDDLKVLEEYDNRMDAEQDANKLGKEARIRYDVENAMEALIDCIYSWSIKRPEEIRVGYLAGATISAIREYDHDRLVKMLEETRAKRESKPKYPSSPEDL